MAAAPLPLMNPRPYQKPLVERVVNGLREHDRGKLIQFCRTGKTAVTIFAAKQMLAERRAQEQAQGKQPQPYRVVIQVPSLDLAAQWIGEIDKFAHEIPADVLAVCSDKDVLNDEERALAGEEMEAINEALHARNGGVRLATNQQSEIASFLNSAAPDRIQWIVSTYQSSDKLAGAQAETGVRVQLLAADEAHVTAQGSKDSHFTNCLKDDLMPAEKHLFATATERHYRRRRGSAEDEVAYSMDNESYYGPTLARYTGEQAMNDGVIVRQRIGIVAVHDASVDSERLREISTKLRMNQEEVQRMAATASALAQAMEEHGLRKIITFHSLVERAQAFSRVCEQLKDVFPVLSQTEMLHINGEMPRGERRDIMSRFAQSQRAIISNAKVLGLGVNIPHNDGVAFVDPKTSEIDIVQYGSRPLTLDPGRVPPKEDGWIILAPFVNRAKGETLQQAIEGTVFEQMTDIVRALGETNPVLVKEATRAQKTKGSGGPQGPGPQPPIVVISGAGFTKEELEAFRVEVLDQSIPDREFTRKLERYAELLSLQRSEPGHEKDRFLLSQRGNDEINALVQWMSKMRIDAALLERGEKPTYGLTHERRVQMEAVVGERFWEEKKELRTWEQSWELYQAALVKQRSQPGHENDWFLSQQKGNDEINGLVRWMSKMRADAALLERGEKPTTGLTLERRVQMEAVVGERFWEEKKELRTWEQSWELYQAALAKQRSQPGHENDRFLSKQKGNEEANTLVDWMKKMRADAALLERGEKPTNGLTHERRVQMEAVVGERFWENGPRASKATKRPSIQQGEGNAEEAAVVPKRDGAVRRK